jgi:glycosyltransferase involved in cell wall biosynthesis
LSKEKNISLLLNSIKRLSGQYQDVKLIIIGIGPEERHLRKLAKDIGISDQVIFLGAIPHIELHHYLRTGIALVISSNYEGTAKVIKEAAFSERMTISTKTSGVSDTIEDNITGIVVPIGEEDAMVRAMKTLLQHPEKALSMGKQAKSFMTKKFDYKKDIERIVGIWESVLVKRDGFSG